MKGIKEFFRVVVRQDALMVARKKSRVFETKEDAKRFCTEVYNEIKKTYAHDPEGFKELSFWIVGWVTFEDEDREPQLRGLDLGTKMDQYDYLERMV